VRLPRFFAKKRGDRRTGAEVWGSVGDALFHSILLSAGILFAAVLLSGVAVPEWRINHHFLATRGIVVGKGLARRTARQATVTWQPCLRLRYPTVDGIREAWATRGSTETDRAAAAEPLGDTSLGTELDCWYDPEAPDLVVLERGYNWWMWALTLLLPGALIAIGGAGVARVAAAWGKSEERQAAVAGRQPARAGPREAGPFPGVPSGDNLENSPGTILAFRLPIESGESWALLGFGLFALLWNTVLVVLAINAGLDLLGGQIDWLSWFRSWAWASPELSCSFAAWFWPRRSAPPRSRSPIIPCCRAATTRCCSGRGVRGSSRASSLRLNSRSRRPFDRGPTPAPNEPSSGGRHSVRGRDSSWLRALGLKAGRNSRFRRLRCTPSHPNTTASPGGWSSAAVPPAGLRSPDHFQC
jgi:hypothetical protein